MIGNFTNGLIVLLIKILVDVMIMTVYDCTIYLSQTMCKKHVYAYTKCKIKKFILKSSNVCVCVCGKVIYYV